MNSISSIIICREYITPHILIQGTFFLSLKLSFSLPKDQKALKDYNEIVTKIKAQDQARINEMRKANEQKQVVVGGEGAIRLPFGPKTKD